MDKKEQTIEITLEEYKELRDNLVFFYGRIL